MSDPLHKGLLGPLVRLFGHTPGQSLGDAELLRRFVAQRDEAAFELLVRRHAALVMNVCRQLLRDEHAVEDAFQATFLVLLRKAGTISQREAFPGWLYRVALRVALRARKQAARHKERPGALEHLPAPEDDPLDDDLRALLHEEVLRLPANYRQAVLTCYLEGKTHDEAARELGWSKGTVAGRLARARDLLRRRLTRRGVAPALAVLAGELLERATSARPPEALLQGFRGAAGLSPQAVALAEGVIGQMIASKIRHVVCLALCLAVLGLGVGLVSVGATTQRAPDAVRAPGEPGREEAEADEPAPLPVKSADPFQEALNRARIRRNLRTLALALHNYNDTNGHLPPPAIVDGAGRPLLSWRVAILPFLEQDALYKEFKLDEPWDSPHNKRLLERMPAVFAPVGVKATSPYTTYYQYIVGPGAVFKSHRQPPPAGGPSGMPGMPGMGTPGGRPGMGGPSMPGGGSGGPMRPGGSAGGPPVPGGMPRGPTPMPGMPGVPGMGMGPRPAADELPSIPRSFPDGTSNTILLVEAATAVPWTKPEDVAYSPTKPVPPLGGQVAGVIHVATADGAVRALPRGISAATLRAVITPDGGEPINMEKLAGRSPTPGSSLREDALQRLRQRNAELKDEVAALKEILAELKDELDGLRWEVEREKLLSLDPAAKALQKENTALEKSLRETRDEARQLMAEIERLKQEMRKRKRE